MSWVDRMQRWVDRLPVHYAIFYSLLSLLFGGLLHAYFWLRGMLPFPTLSSLLLPGVLWVGAPLIIMHLTNNMMLEAIANFQQTGSSGQEISHVKEQVIHMPAGWLLLACLAVAANTYLGTSAYPEVLTPYVQAGLDMGSMLVVTAISFFVVGALIFHTLWLLRTIGRLYLEADQMTILNSSRTYAFTPVTATIALAWGALIYATIATVPGIVSNLVYITITAGLGLIIAGSIASLLVRIYRRLRDEKNAMKQLRIEELYAIYREIDASYRDGEVEQAGALRHVALAKKDELEFIYSLSAWPWQPGTMGGVVSALLLPAVIVLIQEITRRLIP